MSLIDKWLAAGLMSAFSLAPIVSATATDKIDMYSQPQVFEQGTDRYGSGDVKLDGVVNSKDVERLGLIIDGTFSDPSDKRLNARADVNGNGHLDEGDKKDLEDYVNGVTKYLSGQWNQLPNEEERISWAKKTFEIMNIGDKLRANADKFSNPPLNSADFAELAYLNSTGHKGIIEPRMNIEGVLDNALMDIPLYWGKVYKMIDGKAWQHNFDLIAVGDSLNGDIELFRNFLSYEPQGGAVIYPGKGIPTNSTIDIRKINYFFETGGVNVKKLLTFKIDEQGNATCVMRHPDVKRYRDIDTPVRENKQNQTLPEDFVLYQNYPNPFNPSTTIKYKVPKADNVKIEVYNVLGQKIETLVDNYESQGQHEIKWDASKYGSQTFFYRIQAGEFKDIKKMTLVK